MLDKNYIKKTLKNNLLSITLILFIFSLISLALAFYLREKNTCWLLNCESYYSIFFTIGTTILSVTIFKFLLTSNAVLELLKETISSLFVNMTFLERYNEKQLYIIAKKIEDISSYIKVINMEKRVKAINKAKKAYLELKNRKNYFVQELKYTTTIYKNGTCIVNTLALIEVVDNGILNIKYTFESDFKNINYPDFKDFTEDRFSDFSFDARISGFTRNGKVCEQIRLSISIDKDKDNLKELTLKIEDCIPGDIFYLHITRTTPEEYTDDNIEIAKNKKGNLSEFQLSTPIGIRTIIFQEEIYANNHNYNRFNSGAFINDKPLEGIKESNGLSSFYKVKQYNILYTEHTDGVIAFKIY